MSPSAESVRAKEAMVKMKVQLARKHQLEMRRLERKV